ncbi:MAG: hypothetical protein GY698_05365 [Actinomycetia bacterium]|nr:hypothetical protein [Actinomycetes bacterium]
MAETYFLPSRIQVDIHVVEAEWVATYRPDTTEWEFRAGPVFASLVLIDELSRATPKAQSALLEAMPEGYVTVDEVTRWLGIPFFVIATQNPLGEVGTHPLGAAQLDRFSVMLELGLPAPDAELSIIGGDHGTNHLHTLGPVLGDQELVSVFNAVAGVEACESVLHYVLATVNAARALDPDVWLSVRVGETLLRVARGWAFPDHRFRPDTTAPVRMRRPGSANTSPVTGSVGFRGRLPRGRASCSSPTTARETRRSLSYSTSAQPAYQ